MNQDRRLPAHPSHSSSSKTVALLKRLMQQRGTPVVRFNG
jgi:hypothetical protein